MMCTYTTIVFIFVFDINIQYPFRRPTRRVRTRILRKHMVTLLLLSTATFVTPLNYKPSH